MHVRPGPAPSPSRAVASRVVARLIAAIAVLCASIRTPLETSSALAAAITDWTSIVLAALPYVVTGAIAAWVSRRLVDHHSQERHHVVALIAVLNPGCDCALNGFASALARARPSLAGFALTFGAAASPVSLAVTYSAFGTRITIARAAGALVAAALTALAWSLIPFEVAKSATSVGPTFTAGHAADHRGRPDQALDLAAALGGIAFAAAAAISAKILAPPAALAHLAPAGAALLGALLSPCSTADPLLAATLLREARAQLAFMLAAQCLDVRQLLLVLRHFGAARAGAAAACAAGACAIVIWFV